MKRFLFLLLISLSTVGVYSQKYTFKPVHEFYVGCGIAPLQSLYPENTYRNMAYANKYKIFEKDYSVSFSVGYLFHLSDCLAVGLTYAQRNVSLKLAMPNQDDFIASLKNKYRTILFTTKYTWFRRATFALYSRGSVGVLKLKNGTPEYVDESTVAVYKVGGMDDGTRFAWQAMPIGAEWSFVKHLALFAEAGVGIEGFGLAGVKVWF